MERHKRNGRRLTIPSLASKMRLFAVRRAQVSFNNRVPLLIENTGEGTQCYFALQDPSMPLRPPRGSWWRQSGKLGSVERWLTNPVRRKSVSCHSTASPQGSYRRSADSPWKELHPVVLQQEEVDFDTKLIGWERRKWGVGMTPLGSV